MAHKHNRGLWEQHVTRKPGYSQVSCVSLDNARGLSEPPFPMSVEQQQGWGEE